MATCPHCRENSIGFFAKGASSSTAPAKCKRCGGLSIFPKSRGTAASRAFNVLIAALPIVLILAMALTGSLWSIAAIGAVLLAMVGYEALVFFRTPMLATTESEVTEAQHWQLVGMKIIAVVVVIAAIAIWWPRA